MIDQQILFPFFPPPITLPLPVMIFNLKSEHSHNTCDHQDARVGHQLSRTTSESGRRGRHSRAG
jgi:hypothetical protein